MSPIPLHKSGQLWYKGVAGFLRSLPRLAPVVLVLVLIIFLNANKLLLFPEGVSGSFLCG
jgi:hypothetical protein